MSDQLWNIAQEMARTSRELIQRGNAQDLEVQFYLRLRVLKRDEREREERRQKPSSN